MGSETGPSCPEHFTTFNTYDPLDPTSEIDDSSGTVISCLTTCLGPPPEGPNEVTSVLFDGDMSDLNATYPIGTLTTYYCPDGVQKYAICDANGEWSHEDLSTCELSGPDPYVEQNEPLPTPEGCDHIPANLGATVTVGEGECYYIKSHRKYSVIPYPARRSKDEWAFKIDPACQLLRVQFEPAFFGIDGDAFSNCQDGDSLNIWDHKKKKAGMISICGAERPKPMRLFNKNRDKIFQWRSVAGFGQQDGFQAYITVKGCNPPATKDTTTTT